MHVTSDPAIYQLKVVLLGVSPMIWRRLSVRSDSTIADIHFTLQSSMGWTDIHLNLFRIHGNQYGIAVIGGIGFSDDPFQTSINVPITDGKSQAIHWPRKVA